MAGCAAVRHACLSLMVLGVAACASSTASLGTIAKDAGIVGTKLLRPGVAVRTCRRTILGVPVDAASPSLTSALEAALATDSEANVVDNATVTWSHTNAVVYGRECVELRGDVARTVSTVVLPAGSGDHGHH